VLKIFVITFPFFALVLAGYLAVRRRMLALEGVVSENGKNRTLSRLQRVKWP
jgi:hypothetical protein